MERLEYLEKATELLDKGWRMWMWLYANPGELKISYFEANNLRDDSGHNTCYACVAAIELDSMGIYGRDFCSYCELDWGNRSKVNPCTDLHSSYARWRDSKRTDTQAAFEVAELFRTARDRLLSEKAELKRGADK